MALKIVDQIQENEDPLGLLTNLKRLFSKGTNIGIREDISGVESLRVRLFNQAIFLVFIGGMIDTIESIVNKEDGVFVLLLFTSSTLIVYLFHHLNWYISARLFITLFLSSFIFLFFILFGGSLSLSFTYLGFLLAVLIGYDDKRIIFWNTVYILALLIGSLYLTFSSVGVFSDTIDGVDTILNVIVTIIIIIGGVHYFITDLRTQEGVILNQNQELRKKNKKLNLIVKQNEIKNELLRIVAHDLQGPMDKFNKISSNLRSLMVEKKPFEILSLAIEMDQSKSQMVDHLDQLIKWVLSQKEDLKVEKTKFDLRNVIAETEVSFKYSEQEKNVGIQNKVSEELLMFSDKNIIRIILHKLLQIAFDLAPQGSSIVIKVESAPNYIKIILEDLGKYESESALNIFKWSAKLENEDNELGLMICQYLCDVIHAQIIFEPLEPAGKSAILFIPVEGIK